MMRKYGRQEREEPLREREREWWGWREERSIETLRKISGEKLRKAQRVAVRKDKKKKKVGKEKKMQR